MVIVWGSFPTIWSQGCAFIAFYTCIYAFGVAFTIFYGCLCILYSYTIFLGATHAKDIILWIICFRWNRQYESQNHQQTFIDGTVIWHTNHDCGILCKKRNSSMLYTKKKFLILFFMENQWELFRCLAVFSPFFKKRNWFFRLKHYSFQMMMIWNDSFSHEIEIDAIWLRLIQWS